MIIMKTILFSLCHSLCTHQLVHASGPSHTLLVELEGEERRCNLSRARHDL